MNTENNRNSTQVDVGWRNREASSDKRSQDTNLHNAKATEVDAGWRAARAAQNANATEVDEGWRAARTSRAASATEIDEGWRASRAGGGARATQIDEGWRRDAADMLDPENIMNKASANHFRTIDEFKDAVETLTQLTSSNGNLYRVKGTLSRAGGEAIILMCSNPDGEDVVAKVYYEPVNSAGSSISARSRVLEYMGTEEGQKYTLAVLEIGLVEFGQSKYYFEIIPYCEDGDVSDDGAYPFDELVDLIGYLNEALHSIHNAGILHRDIKPQNIYKTKTGVVLGDFGTAKIAENGMSAQTSHIVGTDGYTAPELRLGLTNSPTFFYTDKIDYYSLGVTIGSLFEGHFVYEGMDDAMLLLSVQKGKLPLTRVDPNRAQLENLLNGLCRFDARFRFGYEEVNKWLADHNYTGGGVEEEWPKAFRLLGETYRDEQSMFMGITKDERHWDEAKSMLYSKMFEQFFMSFRTDIARAAQIADEKFRTVNPDRGLAVFLKTLYAPGAIVWKGYTFSSLRELGGKMVATKNPAGYSELLQNHLISHWLSNTEGIKVDTETIVLVEQMEELSAREPEVACYWFGNSFAPERRLEINGTTVRNVYELVEAMWRSPKEFYNGDAYKKLLNRSVGADLYGFLYSFGYKSVIDKEWSEMKKCDMFAKTVLLFSMMDFIAENEGARTDRIRRFFEIYGPIGIAAYIKKLVSNKDSKVYLPLDASGKQILSSIASFKTPNGGSVAELYRAYAPLIESVDKLRLNLTENPHCVLAGVYELSGIICTNLVGCFAYKIFDRQAPLGFNAIIENDREV